MSEIKIEHLTEGCLEGTGAFDELQKSFNAHILEEYTKNRIRGPEYSEVYLGGMQAVLQNAVAFVLGKQKADKEADLIAEKITTEYLVRDKLRAEIELIEKQILKMDFEIAEMEARVWVTKAQVLDNLSLEDPPTALDKGVLGRTVKKLEAETSLLNQKRTTELAQTNASAAGVAQDGHSVVGKEILLRQRQADGFLRDAEQKLSKIVGDSYNVQFSTLDGPGEGGSVPGNLTSGGVDRILNKARTGIGA